MADSDPNPALRAEINAAIDVITPQIEGLLDLQGIRASEEFKKLVADQLSAHERRENLLTVVVAALDAVVAAMDDLKEDGYPNVTLVTTDPMTFEDVKKQKAEVEAALALFEAPPLASRMSINLGDPTPKK